MLTALLFLLAQTAAEPPDPDRLEQVREEQAEAEKRAEQLREEAEAAASEIKDLESDLIALADEIAAAEKRANDLTGRLSRLSVEEAVLTDALKEDRATLMRVMAALQRAEMQRPPPLAVSPDDASDAARSAALLAAVAPQLEERAAELRNRIDSLADIRAQIGEDQTALAEEEAELESRQTEIAGLVDERQDRRAELDETAQAEAQEAARLAEEAESLENLIAEFIKRQEEERRRAEAEAAAAAAAQAEAEAEAEAEAGRQVASRENSGPAVSFAAARGALRPPAQGQVIVGYGEDDRIGESSGLKIVTRAQAQVVSPFDAKVEFAGPFQGYGELLILSVGDGYHIVLSGLARLYTVSGQSVLAGEPVGQMPDRADPAPELYYEIRKDGAPIDPAPWMRPGSRSG